MDGTAAPIVVEPGLLAELRRYGTFDAGACYQCGSCTLSCDLVTRHVTFPRRFIRYGLLGLRQPLIRSVLPWICHDCGDCSTICPRGAEPRISMLTTRRFLAAQYDWTGIAGRVLRSRAVYLACLGGTALLTLALIVLYHVWYKEMALADFATTPLELEHMFPTMVYFTLVVTLLPLVLLASHALRMWWLTMHRGGVPIRLADYAREAKVYAVQSAAQPLLHKCREHARWKWHWMLAAGFAVKLVILVFALRWFQTDAVHPVHHPQRLLGYAITVLLLAGAGGILLCHARGVKEVCKTSSLEDVMFPILLALTAISGLVAHVFRIAGMEMSCHYAYALHVVIATPMLLVEIPFGRPSHMLYRPLALYFQAVRERAAARGTAPADTPRAA